MGEIDELTKDRNAIQNGVCGNAEQEARDILENIILVDKGGDDVVYGSTFGTIGFGTGNITDWEIVTITVPVPPPVLPPVVTPIYTYTPGDYPDLDQLVTDYAFGNDYITRPLTDGATYGLNPTISLLNIGKDILEENKDKVDESIDVFEDYATK